MKLDDDSCFLYYLVEEQQTSLGEKTHLKSPIYGGTDFKNDLMYSQNRLSINICTITKKESLTLC